MGAPCHCSLDLSNPILTGGYYAPGKLRLLGTSTSKITLEFVDMQEII